MSVCPCGGGFGVASGRQNVRSCRSLFRAARGLRCQIATEAVSATLRACGAPGGVFLEHSVFAMHWDAIVTPRSGVFCTAGEGGTANFARRFCPANPKRTVQAQTRKNKTLVLQNTALLWRLGAPWRPPPDGPSF